MGKANYDISKQLHYDLIEAYKRVYHTCFSQLQAYEKMVMEPAPRYYVSPRQASQIIVRMVRGDFKYVNRMSPLRREMYYSLFEVVQQLFEKREFIGKSLLYVMKYAVIQPAPRFFISPIRAKIIRLYCKHGHFDENGKIRDEKVPSYVTCRIKNAINYRKRKAKQRKK